MKATNEIVNFDSYGVFELSDPALLQTVAAGAAAVPDPLSDQAAVADANTVCVNGGCFSVNAYCPTQKICFQVVCI